MYQVTRILLVLVFLSAASPDEFLAGDTHILSKEVRSLARREVVPKPLWRQGFWTRSEREYECQDPPVISCRKLSSGSPVIYPSIFYSIML